MHFYGLASISKCVKILTVNELHEEKEAIGQAEVMERLC